MSLVKAEPAPGFRPPQQERSRKALQKVLTAAQDVLAADGFDDFTMTAVAARAGVSVGAIYRRFDGKEQLLTAVKDRLLTQLEEDLAERLRTAGPSLEAIIGAFAAVIAGAFAAGGQVWPDLLRSRGGPEMGERGLRALAEVRRLFQEGTAPYRHEVRRSDAAEALAAVQLTITGALIHRAQAIASSPDRTPMDAYARQITDMAMAYLRTPDRPAS
jgi:AcrR family transcriptional regulator